MRLKEFFRGFPQFLVDAGWLGMSSELAAIAAFPFALYEHERDRTLTSWTFLGLSIGLFLMGTYVAWRQQYEVAEKYRLFERQKPHILIAKNGFRSEIRGIQGSSEQLCALICDFENCPLSHETEKSNARNVFAKLSFYNIDVEQNPRFLFELDGRWASNHQPGQGKITKEILATDILVGQKVQLDIANRFLFESEAFAVDNESAWFTFRKPDQKLEGTRFLVEVRLLAVGVMNNFEFKFENRGKWDYLQPIG
jgi:hypothetical protein